jgi:hypothetical protein
MDLVDQAVQALLEGAGQGTAKVVTLGTTTAAVALWNRLKKHFTRTELSLDVSQREVLSAEPGQEVDLVALRRVLQLLPPATLKNSLTIQGDYVGRDYVAGDYVAGDKIGGDKILGDQNTFNFGNS